MKKVAFHNLGCKVNSYELDGISQMFQKRGYEIVDFAQKADVYIVNTCTVTNIADHKSRQMLNRAKAQNPDAIVVAAGCFVQTSPDALALPSVDIAVGNNHKSQIVDLVEEYIREKSGGSIVSDLSGTCGYEEMCVDHTTGNTRAYMKIQDGCNQFCSYCAIPLARGRVRSRDMKDIATEAARLAANGYKEIVVTGIHISSYGLDSAYNGFADRGDTNTALLDVIRTVSQTDGIERVRLGSLEPRLLTDDFISSLSQIKGLCPHFHLSLQSGSDSVLGRMKRHYNTKEYAEKVEKLRAPFEHPAITTDVIVGFPAETDEEFDETRAFLDRMNLYECHIFKYSRRKGTAADAMDGQITEAVKSERAGILSEDSKARKRAFMEYYRNKTVDVLTEDTEELDGRLVTCGYTPEYVRVSMPPCEGGIITQILCFEYFCDTMFGKCVDR